MSQSGHLPQMIRGLWNETSKKVNLGLVAVKLLGTSSYKRRILPGATVNNTTGSARTVTFYVTTSSESRDQTTNFCEDLPLAAKEMVELPQWILLPTWELWAEADANSAVNLLLNYGEEYNQ